MSAPLNSERPQRPLGHRFYGNNRKQNYFTAHKMTATKANPRLNGLRQSTGELSLDVNDILSMDLDHSPVEEEPPKKSSSPSKLKCWPTLLGGTRNCSGLHCRDCDFPVSSFWNYEWSGEVEYLFLRTNMPDVGKVLGKLRRKNGAVAYACHCVSFSTEKEQPLHETALPWFCRGHI